eukprot:TRINITY_DN2009_c0_g2_i2.p2 TRINITY_DN2009_c0_g2~~TRINITY_DN2009_c0_g2_i2.p2  ORF type:complete len:136 (-),score=9.91 TRINITY_DN2009_c0_g2_i2:329-736(-)
MWSNRRHWTPAQALCYCNCHGQSLLALQLILCVSCAMCLCSCICHGQDASAYVQSGLAYLEQKTPLDASAGVTQAPPTAPAVDFQATSSDVPGNNDAIREAERAAQVRHIATAQTQALFVSVPMGWCASGSMAYG